MSLELRARLTLDRTGFTHGMNFSKQEVQAWNRVIEKGSRDASQRSATTWGAAWGAIAAAAAVAGKTIIDSISFGGKFQDMSDRLGMNPEKLQQWNYEAQQTGSSGEAVVSAVQKLAVASQSALGGNEEMANALQRLGLTMDDLRNKSLEELFEQLRGNMRGARIDAEKMADILKVMGRGAGGLIPFLKAGGDPGSELVASSKETIAGLDAIGDTWHSITASLGKRARDLTEKTVGPILDILSLGGVHRRKRENLAAGNAEDKRIAAEAESREEAKAAQEAEKAAKKREQEEAEKARRLSTLEAARDKTRADLEMSRATPEQKIALLQKRLDEEKLKSLDLSDKEGALRAAADANRTQQEIESLRKKEGVGFGELFGKGPSDQLLGVGNFLGAGFHAMTGAQMLKMEMEKSRQELVAIREHIQKQKVDVTTIGGV